MGRVGAAAVAILSLLLAQVGGLAAVDGDSGGPPAVARAPVTTPSTTTTTTTTSLPTPAPITTIPAPTTTAPTTTIAPKAPTTSVRPTATTVPPRQIIVLTIPAVPAKQPSATVKVSQDLEIRLPAQFSPYDNDVGNADPAILRRDLSISGCDQPACVALTALTAGKTEVVFITPNACGLPRLPACPTGEVDIPLVVTVEVVG